MALNRFPGDSEEELQAAAEIAMDAGAYSTAEYAGFTDGGEGGMALAEAVARATGDADAAPKRIDYAYELDGTIEEKTLALAKRVYGAESVSWSAEGSASGSVLHRAGFGATCPSAWRRLTCQCLTTRR